MNPAIAMASSIATITDIVIAFSFKGIPDYFLE